ncbi:hypothetical protein TCAP_02203 [Tolypocladium capitatum]|uniref:Uncharacterized protein n=1 Tax=Tolypocladium capitatum TaxID=45235 RepID=A0A2K3QJZ5_9HYPO|nr:hypothetical protein TCAP_02203 [Tolypocladium capitatum]
MSSWAMELVTPETISWRCLSRLRRLFPRPLSSVPVDRVPSRLDLPEVVGPVKVTRSCGVAELPRLGTATGRGELAALESVESPEPLCAHWGSFRNPRFGVTRASATHSLPCLVSWAGAEAELLTSSADSTHSQSPTMTMRTTSTAHPRLAAMTRRVAMLSFISSLVSPTRVPSSETPISYRAPLDSSSPGTSASNMTGELISTLSSGSLGMANSLELEAWYGDDCCNRQRS